MRHPLIGKLCFWRKVDSTIPLYCTDGMHVHNGVPFVLLRVAGKDPCNTTLTVLCHDGVVREARGCNLTNLSLATEG